MATTDPARDEGLRAFATLWETLGLGDVAERVELAGTITARTLDALRETGSAPEPIAPSPLASNAERTVPTLPPLGVRYAPREPAATDESAHELQVLSVLGEGGMGRVHLARQRALRREVALKTLKSDVVSAAAVEALLVEARTLGSLEHPNIPPVHGLGRDDQGLPVLVMKRIDGAAWSALLADPAHPLWARLRAGHSEPLLANLAVLLQVCNAVQFAHSRGVVHRDIKPENVMLGAYGEVYLVDWGVATRLDGREASERRASIVGTPLYMAPEMVAAGRVDARTDVYLLGATLHELLVGAPRHAAESLQAALCKAFLSEPVSYDPTVPAELGAVCNKATAAAPDERFADVEAFRRAIERYVEHRASIALTDAADARRVELAREARENGAGDDRVRRWYELSSECRLGYTEALRGWSENARAREGLQACLELMIEHELRHGHLDAAVGLVAALPEARPALDARVTALREELAVRRAGERRLEQLERDRDVTVAGNSRAVFFVVVALAILAIGVLAPGQSTGPTTSARHRELLGIGLFGNALTVVLVALFWRRMTSNLFNRQLLAMFAFGGLLITFHRALAWYGGDSAKQVLATEMLMFCTSGMATAVFSLRSFWWLSAVFGAGATTIYLFPSRANHAFTISVMLVMLLGVEIVRRAGLASQREGSTKAGGGGR